jgi:hypothetical protein
LAPTDLASAAEQLVERYAVGGDQDGLETADVAVHREPAEQCEPFQVGVTGLAADRVEDHIEPLGGELGGELLAHQYLVVAELGGVAGLGGAADHADDPARTGQLRELSGEGTDLAGRGVDQHALAGPHPGDGVDQIALFSWITANDPVTSMTGATRCSWPRPRSAPAVRAGGCRPGRSTPSSERSAASTTPRPPTANVRSQSLCQ